MMNRIHAFCGITLAIGSLASGQTLSVNDPRPMMAVVDKLQGIMNVPINYEDPRFEHPGDLQDVTDTVVKNRAQFAGRVLIPRGGSLTVTAPNSPLAMTPGNLFSIFSLIKAAHEGSRFPGRFTIVSRNGSWYVEPTALTNLAGTTMTVGSVMATSIRFPFRQQSGAEALQFILGQVSQAVGVKIGIGAVPFAALSMPITLAADDEPASTVIGRLFSQLSAPGTRNSDAPRWSYRLLFDPGLRYYMFNMSSVGNEHPVAPPSANILQQPADDSKVVRKPKN